jgi:protein-tyrosine-phosphatase/rhodanese-related sulfurtransferase
VVVYDDAGGSIAARLWWMLTDQGHTKSFVLDGGINAWIASGHGTETGDPNPAPKRAAGVATKPWDGIVSIAEVARRSDGTVLIDARAPERFRGDTEPIDPKPGHIPGAINIPTSENLVDGRFATSGQLRDRYADSGVSSSTKVMIHCGSGVTACHNILAMELAGFPRPSLYVGSWSDWSSTDRPVAVGNSEPDSMERPADKPSVLFLCVHNAGRSQMAAGWMRSLGQDRVDVFSGGSEPADSVNHVAVQAMAEEGIDISVETPQRWSDDAVRAADVVVSMGCGDACPVFPGKRYIDWELDDPAGKSIDTVRPIRDDIKDRVVQLLAELGIDTRS